MNPKDFILECKQFLKEINNLGKSEFITVASVKEENKTFFCALVTNEKVETDIKVNKDYSWDLYINSGAPGVYRNDEGKIEYYRFSNSGIENFVYYRSFEGIENKFFEMSEEFRLFFNLYQEDSKFFHFDDNGDKNLVVEIIDNEVSVKLKYLKKYISTRDKSLVIFFDYFIYDNKTLEENNIMSSRKEVKGEDNIFYSMITDNIEILGDEDERSICKIIGKKIIAGIKDYIPPIWSDDDKNYEKFIIAIDEDGNDILFSSDEKRLANNFGANQGAPQYLTPVFFKKEVLQKYYNTPNEYRVNDSSVERIGFWNLPIDNNKSDCIMVFLGDLGKLANKEQQYWKSFNTYSESGLSITTYERSLLGKFSDPIQADLYFKQSFEKFQEKWQNKYGWYLFKPLSTEDEHHITSLHIPLTENQKEFDEQIISLVKIIIDSLNEKQLKKEITIELKNNAKGIDKLDAYLQSKEIKLPDMINFLRDLQSLRSTGSVHRKSSNYEKPKEKFGLNNNFSEVFKDILKKTIMIFKTMTNCFIDNDVNNISKK